MNSILKEKEHKGGERRTTGTQINTPRAHQVLTSSYLSICIKVILLKRSNVNSDGINLLFSKIHNVKKLKCLNKSYFENRKTNVLKISFLILLRLQCLEFFLENKRTIIKIILSSIISKIYLLF